jgi:aryl-alcohol dehydrogenase-like predicted oxidoreductase
VGQTWRAGEDGYYLLDAAPGAGLFPITATLAAFVIADVDSAGATTSPALTFEALAGGRAYPIVTVASGADFRTAMMGLPCIDAAFFGTPTSDAAAADPFADPPATADPFADPPAADPFADAPTTPPAAQAPAFDEDAGEQVALFEATEEQLAILARAVQAGGRIGRGHVGEAIRVREERPGSAALGRGSAGEGEDRGDEREHEAVTTERSGTKGRRARTSVVHRGLLQAGRPRTGRVGRAYGFARPPASATVVRRTSRPPPAGAYPGAMRTRTIGSLEVSVVGLGCNNFGRRLDLARTQDVVDAALEAGVTLLDTADIYGGSDSEVFLGRVLRGRRDRVVLATKFGAPLAGNELAGARPETIHAALDASLQRLGMDHVDLYQLHFPDPDVPIAETLGALGEEIEAGRVREIGASNLTAEQLAEAEAVAADGGPRFVSLQNEYSLLRREAEEDVLPACRAADVAFLPYFPLLSGILTGKYRQDAPLPEGTRIRGNERWEGLLTPELYAALERLEAIAARHGHELIDLAFAYLLAEPAVASVIAGATRPEQVRRNVRAGGWELDDALLAEVRAVLDDVEAVAPA